MIGGNSVHKLLPNRPRAISDRLAHRFQRHDRHFGARFALVQW